MYKENLNWRQTVLTQESTIRNVVENLNFTGQKIVLIIDSDGKFLGTVTDGDIRRGLLSGLNLESEIKGIINFNSVKVYEETDISDMNDLIVKEKVWQIPVVDDLSRPVGLYSRDEIITPLVRENPFVIMAGGRGLRLEARTVDCPKPMLQISGKPILEHIIERAKKQGFCNFFLSVNYLAHVIENYFGDGTALDVNIHYIREESPLGTAGSLSLIKFDSTSVITNGDVISKIDYGRMLDFHTEKRASATIAVRMHDYQNPFGVVYTDAEKVIGYEEKPVVQNNINAGVYVLNSSSLDLLEKQTYCDMPELIEKIRMLTDNVFAYPIHEPWIDIGRPDDFDKASKMDSEKTESEMYE